TPVAEFQRAFAEAAAGNDGNRVGKAAIDFDEGDQAFAVVAVRIVNAEKFESEHGHAHSKHLAGAEVPVSALGLKQIVGEGWGVRHELEAVLGSKFSVLSDFRTGGPKGSARFV